MAADEIRWDLIAAALLRKAGPEATNDFLASPEFRSLPVEARASYSTPPTLSWKSASALPARPSSSASPTRLAAATSTSRPAGADSTPSKKERRTGKAPHTRSSTNAAVAGPRPAHTPPGREAVRGPGASAPRPTKGRTR